MSDHDTSERAARHLAATTLVPLFPLLEHVLLPASPTPYRIFDDAHRAMVVELLEKPLEERFLVLPRVIAGDGAPHGEEAIHPIATLARLTLVTPLADGDFLVVVEGIAPCRLREVDAPFTPYRVAEVTMMTDRPRTPSSPETSTAALVSAFMTLLSALGPAAGDIPLAYGGELQDALVTYRIASAVLDDVDLRQAVLDERCPNQRRRRVMDGIVALLDVAARCGDARLAAAELPS